MRNSETFLLDTGSPKGKSAKRLSALRPRQLKGTTDIAKAIAGSKVQDRWIVLGNDGVAEIVLASSVAGKRLGVLWVLDKVRPETVPALSGRFHRVVISQQPESYLPLEELAEVLEADNRDELFVGGSVDRFSQTVTLWRGDGTSLVVPMSAFEPSGAGVAPDFDRFAVIDYGHTLRFGDYEASADAVLYEFDPEYRRRLNARRRRDDKGFGSALRRLRKQRKMLRSDFAPLSEKTIARIERGEVHKPRGVTLKRIAKRLGVAPDDIETF